LPILVATRLSLLAIACATILAAGAALTAFFSSGAGVVLARFSNVTDERILFWQDANVAIAQFWPFGSGLGTWVRVYPIFESLDVLGPTIVNNAHNDYLELVLEAGALALVPLLLFVGYYLFGFARLLNSVRRGRPATMGVAAGFAILLVMLHSIVDYPLRMLSIQAIFGLLSALLVMSVSASALPKPTRSQGRGN